MVILNARETISAISTTDADILRHVVDLAKAIVAARRVVLFGSRARGDARDHSDFDIAVWPEKAESWGVFTAEVEEQVRTLHRFDLVNMNRCQSDLRAAIEREGRVLYDVA